MKNDFDKIFRNMKAKDYMKTRPYPPFTHKISISKIDNLMEQYANERVIEELENLDNTSGKHLYCSRQCRLIRAIYVRLSERKYLLYLDEIRVKIKKHNGKK